MGYIEKKRFILRYLIDDFIPPLFKEQETSKTMRDTYYNQKGVTHGDEKIRYD